MDHRTAAWSNLPYRRKKLFLSQGDRWRVGTHLKASAFFCAAICGLLMACRDGLPFLLGGSDNAGTALDAKAIEAGILPDSKNSGLAGRYETHPDNYLALIKLASIRTWMKFMSR
jgi:hypothetical protein